MKDKTIIWFAVIFACQVVLAVCGFLMQAQLNDLKNRPAAPCVAIQQFEDLGKRVREIETRIKIGELIDQMDEKEKALNGKKKPIGAVMVKPGVCRECGNKSGQYSMFYCDPCFKYAAERNVRADELEE